MVESENIEALIALLNIIFFNRLTDFHSIKIVTAMKDEIRKRNGNINIQKLSSMFYYSEKHIRRLFFQYIGTSPKMFMRIARVNQALCLLQSKTMNFTDIAMQTGFFD